MIAVQLTDTLPSLLTSSFSDSQHMTVINTDTTYKVGCERHDSR